MFAVTAILSCVIKIRGLFKSTKLRHFENVKFKAVSARRAMLGLQKLSETVRDYTYLILTSQTSTRGPMVGHEVQNLDAQ